jgi:integrase
MGKIKGKVAVCTSIFPVLFLFTVCYSALMAVLVECPACRQRNSLRNKLCTCGENLDKAKKAKRVKYWIAYRLPVMVNGLEKKVQKFECIGLSIEEARDADGKRRGQKRENRVFEILPSGQMTFQELTDWYTKQDAVKAKRYFPDFLLYISNFNREFGQQSVNKIDTMDIMNYQARRKAEGYSDSYVDHEVGAAKTIVYAAEEAEKISIRVLKKFKKVPKLLKKGRNQRTRVLSVPQFVALMQHLPLHTKRIMTVAFYTGMRRSEITQLTWNKVNMNDLHIELSSEDTKDADPRIVPFGAEIETVFKAIGPRTDDAYVFLYRGKPVHDLREGIRAACAAAGIPYGQRVKGGFVFHDLRHTFNTFMRKAGVAAAVTKDITGHDSYEMYDWYNTIDQEDRRLAVSRFEEFIQKELKKHSGNANVDQSVDQG